MDAELRARLDQIQEGGLHRELRTVDSPQGTRICLQGREYVNFSSNDYLGLANHPRVREGAMEAVARYGAGAGASRLVCGSQRPHQELDFALADFKQTEAAVSFVSGYAAASGAICALTGREDILILDKLVHACVVDAARLSGAIIRVFRHNDLDSLQRLLQWADQHRSTRAKSQVMVATESVFSMDGDVAPLAGIVELKEKYGAWLMLDEAHATGVMGHNRRGLAEESGLGSRIEVQMGTLGKALGAAGGYIAGSRTLVDYLVNKARSLIFSTAPVPAAAGAALAALALIKGAEGERRCKALWELIRSFSTGSSPARSAILPVLVGDELRAMEAAQRLREKGFYIPAIRFPTVARGKARLRVTLTADHLLQDVAALRTALQESALSPGPANPVTSSHA